MNATHLAEGLRLQPPSPPRPASLSSSALTPTACAMTAHTVAALGRPSATVTREASAASTVHCRPYLVTPVAGHS